MSEVRWRSRRKMTKIENHTADVEISFKLFFSFRGFFELEMKSKAPSRIVGRGKVGQRKNKGRRTKNLESFPVSSEKHFSFFLSSMKTFILTSELPSLSSELPFDGVVVEFLFLLAIFLFLSLYTFHCSALSFFTKQRSSNNNNTKNLSSRTENEEIG